MRKIILRNIFLIPLVFIFLFLRLNHLKASLNFSTDQGLGLLETYEIYQSKKIRLIGFTGLSFTESGRYIYNSALLYYLLLPLMLLFKWNPLPASYFFIFLQLMSLIIIYGVLRKHYGYHLSIVYSTLYVFFPPMIDYSRFIWTPNLLIPLSGLCLALLLLLKKSKKNYLLFLLGFFWGIGLQLHYSFLLVMILSLFSFFLIKKIRVRE